MPELNPQTDEKFEVSESTSMAYGSKFLTGSFPKEEVYPVAWNRENNLFWQSLFVGLEGKVNYFLTAFVNQESMEVSEARSFLRNIDPFTQENLLAYEAEEIQE